MYKIYQITHMKLKSQTGQKQFLFLKKQDILQRHSSKITATTTLQIDIRFEPELYLAKIKTQNETISLDSKYKVLLSVWELNLKKFSGLSKFCSDTFKIFELLEHQLARPGDLKKTRRRGKNPPAFFFLIFVAKFWQSPLFIYNSAAASCVCPEKDTRLFVCLLFFFSSKRISI